MSIALELRFFLTVSTAKTGLRQLRPSALARRPGADDPGTADGPLRPALCGSRPAPQVGFLCWEIRRAAGKISDDRSVHISTN